MALTLLSAYFDNLQRWVCFISSPRIGLMRAASNLEL